MKNPILETMLLSVDLKECHHGHAPKHKKRFKKKTKKLNRNYNKRLAQELLDEVMLETPQESFEQDEDYSDYPSSYDEPMWEDLYDWDDSEYLMSLEEDYDNEEKAETYELHELLEMNGFIPF